MPERMIRCRILKPFTTCSGQKVAPPDDADIELVDAVWRFTMDHVELIGNIGPDLPAACDIYFSPVPGRKVAHGEMMRLIRLALDQSRAKHRHRRGTIRQMNLTVQAFIEKLPARYSGHADLIRAGMRIVDRILEENEKAHHEGGQPR